MVTLRTGQVTWPDCCRVDDAEVRPGLFDSVTWTLSSGSLYEWCDHTQTEWSLTTWPLTLLTNRMLTAYIFSSLKLNSYREVSFPSSSPPWSVIRIWVCGTNFTLTVSQRTLRKASHITFTQVLSCEFVEKFELRDTFHDIMTWHKLIGSALNHYSRPDDCMMSDTWYNMSRM